MNTRPLHATISACVLGLLLTATAALGQKPPATERVDPTRIALQPSVPWDRASLVVAGSDGYRWERVFVSGEAIELGAFDAAGDGLPDGYYKYELRLSLTGPALNEREKAERRFEAVPTIAHYGTFAIRDGQIQASEQTDNDRDSGAPGIAPPVDPGAVDPDTNVVEEHFGSQDVGTAAEMCIGCSSTFEPENEKLIIIDGTPAINLQNAETPTLLWEIELVGSGDLLIEDISGTDIVVIEDGAPANSLRVDSSGAVGIGVASPGAELHTFDTFINDFRMENLFGGLHSQWSLSADENRFQIEDQENGTIPFRIDFAAPTNMLLLDSTGNVGIDVLNPQHKLHVGGDLGVDGDLNVSSSRLRKKDFTAIDSGEVLERVVSLPLQEWTYIDDANASRHLGPMAEDFHAAFNLGSSEWRLSPSDEAGVALAAIQGLHDLVVEENQALRARLATLEAVIEALTSE